MAKLYTLSAEYHKQVKNGAYRIKISLPELGMYINGILAYPPSAERKEWVVYPPAQHLGRGKYITLLEFNKKLPLWQEIESACIDEAKNVSLQSKDILIDDISDEPIDLRDIQSN